MRAIGIYRKCFTPRPKTSRIGGQQISSNLEESIYYLYDQQTIAFFGLVFHGLFSIVFFLLWLENRSRVKGVGFWTLNLVLHGIGRLMATITEMQGQPLLMFIGNLLTLSGAVLFLFGLASFVSLNLHALRYIGFLIVFTLGFFVIHTSTENLVYQSMLYAITIVVLICRYLPILWVGRTMGRHFRKIFTLLFVVYILMSVLYSLRLVSDIIQLDNGVVLLEYDTDSLRLSQLLSLSILVTVDIAILILINNKLLHDLSLEGEKKSRLVMKFRKMAEIDMLTGILNRNGIENILDTTLHAAIEQSEIMIGMLDVDDFKIINDNYGHEVGDQVLIRLGKIFTSIIRDSDHVGRWGGDEFFFLFNSCSSEPETSFSHRLHEKIGSYPWDRVLNVPALSVTVSFGYTRFRQGESKRQLLRRCDKQLYIAKNSGKNRSCNDYSYMNNPVSAL